MIPDRPDRPGVNVDLHPAAAPVWLRPMFDDITVEVPLVRPEQEEVVPPEVRHSAVLMAVAGDPAAETRPRDARILLTHRSPDMRSHAGQLAFPGGRVDPADVNAVDAALREAWEETGLDREHVTPVAQLPQIHVRSSARPVHPVVAWWHTPRELYPASEEETDDVFTVTIDHLTDPANRLTVGWGDWRGPAFYVQDYLLWGFTAGLVAGALTHAGWDLPWHSERIYDLRATLDKCRNNEATFRR